MKSLITILLCLWTFSIDAQQVPALLSIEGIGGNSYDQISSRVVPTSDGGFILALYTSSTTGDILCDTTPVPSVFKKYNSDVTILEWTRCHTGVADSSFDYLFPTIGGNFVLGGHSFTNTDQDFLLRKETAVGNPIWGNKKYGGSGGEILEDMLATSDGGYVMFGTTNSSDGDVGFHHGNVFNDDLWVLKVDSNGNKLWGTVLGGTADERAYALATAPGNGVYVAGA
ncbi:MAG: hypothetical protein JSS82_04225, partial [Bacteroidetes bacterium]|nr:hypothetical protein [Bacteroidota bacterium]